MKRRKMNSAVVVLLSLVLGILVGMIVHACNEGGGPFMSVVSFIGALYLNLLKMMVYPLIFCAVVVGITEVGNATVTGKIAVKSIIYFIFTTALASIVAVVIPTVMKLGVNSSITIEQTEITSEMTGILDMLANMIPANPIASFTNGDVMQILVFAIFIGFGIMIVGEKAEPVLTFFKGMNEICMVIIKFAVKFTPIGAFCLIMPITAQNKIGAVSDLLAFVGTYYITIIAFAGIVYMGLLKISGAKPMEFLKASFPAICTAFVTFSSTAALPVSTECADNMGIRKEISSIVIPIGSTMNMDAGAIMLLMSIVFYCNICGIQLSMGQLVTLVIANIFLSIGTPAIPNGGIATFTALVVMAGLPGGVMSIFVGAMSLCNTAAVNILGDLSACKLLDQLETNRQHKSITKKEKVVPSV